MWRQIQRERNTQTDGGNKKERERVMVEVQLIIVDRQQKEARSDNTERDWKTNDVWAGLLAPCVQMAGPACRLTALIAQYSSTSSPTWQQLKQTRHTFLHALDAHSDAGKHIHKLTHVYAFRPTRCQSIQCHSHRQVTGCAVVCSQASSRCKVEEGACYRLSKSVWHPDETGWW